MHSITRLYYCLFSLFDICLTYFEDVHLTPVGVSWVLYIFLILELQPLNHGLWRTLRSRVCSGVCLQHTDNAGKNGISNCWRSCRTVPYGFTANLGELAQKNVGKEDPLLRTSPQTQEKKKALVKDKILFLERLLRTKHGYSRMNHTFLSTNHVFFEIPVDLNLCRFWSTLLLRLVQAVVVPSLWSFPILSSTS